jgi:hypothetical protein
MTDTLVPGSRHDGAGLEQLLMPSLSGSLVEFSQGEESRVPRGGRFRPFILSASSRFLLQPPTKSHPDTVL